MQNKTIFALVALLIVGIVAAGGASAFGLMFGQGDENDAIRTAIENKDFNAWKTAIEAKLTQENFQKLTDWHSAMLERRNQMDALKTAVEEGDYDAYVDAAEQLNDVASEEDFNTMVEIHKAMQEGDYETARELRQELGANAGFGMRMGKMHHFGKRRN